MWNGRFAALSGDPFDNSAGFSFPAPEGTTRFPPNDPIITHLLIAQGHMPPTELVEVAGFTGTRGTIGPRFDQFDDGLGSVVPPPDASGYRNEPIRQAVLERLNSTPAYRHKFGTVFPTVAAGAPIDFSMFGRAIAEFEFTLVFANAPIDRYARGNLQALSEAQKRGALIFFGKGKCVQCHAVAGQSNEMFSDFRMHDIGVPQIAPAFGVGKGNVIFDGQGQNEDFGLEQITGKPGGSIQVSQLTAQERRAATRVLPQWRVHKARGRDPPSPGCEALRARLRSGQRRTGQRPDAADRTHAASPGAIGPLARNAPGAAARRISRPRRLCA